MRPKTHITYTQPNYIQWTLKICDQRHTQHTHKQIKYNKLYRYETKDTHNIHTNKFNTMILRDMRPKTHITYTQTN